MGCVCAVVVWNGCKEKLVMGWKSLEVGKTIREFIVLQPGVPRSTLAESRHALIYIQCNLNNGRTWYRPLGG